MCRSALSERSGAARRYENSMMRDVASGSGSLDALLARLDPDERVRGIQFERVCRWYLENAPEYWSVVRRVWLWQEWPSRWGADAGIDLVVETHDGDLWAVQAKAYGPAYSVTKRDVDSFISESNRPVFAYRLLIATTDRIARNARSALEGQEKPVGQRLLSDLRAAGLLWPSSPLRLLPVKPKPKRLRTHQRKAVRDVARGFTKSERGQLLMACGTGKTLVGLHVAEKLRTRRTLVLLPSLSLVEQTLREWTANTPRPLAYLAVCSDESVADHDSAVASTSELGVPVTTDPEAIARFLRRQHEHAVVFATYQSSERVAQAQRGRVPGFDLVIADEAHRCAGPAAGMFAIVLDEAKIKARWRLFMTATPRYFTGRVKKAAEEADYEVASMDDPGRFGPVLHRLTFAQAIVQDLLSDYQVVVVGVSDATYRDYAQRGRFVTADGETVTDARTLASQLGLLRAMAKDDLRRVVSFHSRIANARSFATSLPEVNAWMPARRRPTGGLWTEHVSGEMSSGVRRARIDRLRDIGDGERGVLTNARCLTEGVDVPTLDGVAFIDPRRSQIDIVQAVGRAIRKAKDKAIGTIIVPVFVDETADAETVLEASEFDRVWQVVNALRAHDEVLADELDELRRERGRHTQSSGRPDKIVLDLPVGIGDAFERAFDAKVVDTATASWEFWFGTLERLVEREGHARAPALHKEEGLALGSWINRQRTSYARGTLTEDRAAALEALSGWVWDELTANWEDGFGRLGQFVEREGHARVPRGDLDGEFKLGRWVRAQRHFRRAGTLAPEREARLAGVPGWAWHTFAEDWERSFHTLEAFVGREGHSLVPHEHLETGFKLGYWVGKQRDAHRDGTLEYERARRLQALPGWAWDARAAKWEKGFDYLTRFAAREGHVRVPARYGEDGFQLGGWVTQQRHQYKAGSLLPDRRGRLEAMPGWTWDARDAEWEGGFQCLWRFAEREGHARVPQGHIESGLKLGTWVSGQRGVYKRGKLEAERLRRLESLPGWAWNPRDARWEEGFARLGAYVERTRHALVPEDHVEDGFRLGGWVATQRSLFRREKLDAFRTSRLVALPGWTWAPHDSSWEQSFGQFERFVAREGHGRVPQGHVESGLKLGTWVSGQRGAFRAGKLEAERLWRLESIPGWTWDGRR